MAPRQMPGFGWVYDEATPEEYLERLILSNRFLGTDFWLETIGNYDDHICFEISQTFVQFDSQTGPLDSRECWAVMVELGFSSDPDGSFYFHNDHDIVVTDLHAGNIVRDSFGIVHFIDALIARF